MAYSRRYDSLGRPRRSLIYSSSLVFFLISCALLLRWGRGPVDNSSLELSPLATRTGTWQLTRGTTNMQRGCFRPISQISKSEGRVRHGSMSSVRSAMSSTYPPFVDEERAQEIEEVACQNMLKSMSYAPVEVSFSRKPISTTAAGEWVSSQKLADGAPVVLLHGFDSSILEFRRFVPKMVEKEVSTFAIDLIGWGFAQAEEEFAGISPREKREHLYEYWRQHIKKPMVLCGASLGGAVAIDFALEHPDAVKGLVLIDAQAYIDGVQSPPEIFMNIGLNVLRSEPLRQIANVQSYFDKDTYATKDAMRIGRLHTYMPNWKIYNKQWMQGGGYTLSGRIRDVSVPTLILWGEQDKILGVEPATRFQEDIPGSKLVWVPECGHVPHLEQADFTADALVSFMKEL